MGVSHRYDSGQEIGLGAQRLAKSGERALRLALREKRPPELVVDAGQRRLLLPPVASAEGDDTLLRAQRTLPLPVGEAQIPQRSERGHVVVVARQQALEQGGGLAGAARPPEVLRRREHEVGLLLVPERVEVGDQCPFGVSPPEPKLAQPRSSLPLTVSPSPEP